MSDQTSSEESQWQEEAQAVISDVQEHVQHISISSKLKSSCKRIYMNLVTLEEVEYCIEMTARGFRIVGEKFDITSQEDGRMFETPYSLLESISPKYRESFGQQLVMKLTRLQSDETS